MDYQDMFEIVSFDACEVEQCVDVFIIHDDVPEDLESFFVNLDAPGLNEAISLGPTQATIDITDASSTYILLFEVHF